MRIPLLLLLGTWLAACAGGCISYATTFEGNPVTWDMAEFPKVGKTTKAEVLQELGAPRQIEAFDVTSIAESIITRAPSESLTVKLDPAMRDEVYIYERAATTRFGLILGFFNYYTSDTKVDRLTVVFDRKDKVIAVGYTAGADASESAMDE
ncbi:MAG: hypothetical protein ACYTGX_03310 [Planctomycetota bacterium]|jgi:hypothetical protein